MSFRNVLPIKFPSNRHIHFVALWKPRTVHFAKPRFAIPSFANLLPVFRINIEAGFISRDFN